MELLLPLEVAYEMLEQALKAINERAAVKGNILTIRADQQFG